MTAHTLAPPSRRSVTLELSNARSDGLRTPEAARYLGLSGSTLEKHRTYGTGPIYRKIGGRVVYALDDLKAWTDLAAKTSTSDPGKGTVLPAKKHPVLRPYAGQERR
jgi:predicted DNA-binding transcriptional regulator AlpA